MYWNNSMEKIDDGNVVGLTVSQATSKLALYNKTIRILEQDNNYFMGSCDYQPDRVNVAVVGNIITKSWLG